MALSGSTVLEVRIGGSDTNGGGFVTGASGTDFSQQNSAQIAVSDAQTFGTTTITSVTAGFSAAVVGNLIYITGGSASIVAGWYQVVSWSAVSPNNIVVDRNTGLTAGTNATLNLGGALASPGQAGAIATVVGMIVFIKYNVTAFVMTSTTLNVAGGLVSGTSGTYYIGYDTTRAAYTPYQNRPTIQLSVTPATMFGNLNATYSLQSVILDATSQTTSRCFNSSGECFYVKVMNFTTGGIQQNNATAIATLCEITGGTGNANCLVVSNSLLCISHDNTLPGASQGQISIPAGGVCTRCIVYGSNQDGIILANDAVALNCVSYNNTARGFYFGNVAGPTQCINCIAEANGNFGFLVNTGTGQLLNCADYNNTSGRKNNPTTAWAADVNPITGTGSFFNNAAAHDFTLNNTAGAGAAARAAGFPANFLGMNNYLDVGAVQHQDAGGGPSVTLMGQIWL